jgi:hypothetical protein
MLILKSKITITQQPTAVYPNRNLVTVLDFVNNIEINSAWQNLTDTGKIVLPKKVYYKNQFGKSITWDGQNIISGVNGKIPLVLRGDKIKIELGYEYNSLKISDENIKVISTQKTQINKVFEGYISNVDNRIPIELHFEDNMYVLKQIQAENKTWKGSEYTLESMLEEMLLTIPGNPFTIKKTIKGAPIETKIGDFTTQNETIAEVLNRLQKDYRFESYFRENELRCGYIVYYPEDIKTSNFKFQYNIISDDLLYKRKDDIIIGVEAKAYKMTATSKNNKDGTTKFKTEQISYFGYFKNNELQIVPVEQKPKTFDGEIRTINLKEMPLNQVKDYVTKELNRVTFDGWRGKFVTFGLPLVKHGDVVQLIDEVIPERTGQFLVKGVQTNFGVNGFRQEISLDLRFDTLTQAEINSGL